MDAFIATYGEWTRLTALGAPYAVKEAAWLRYTMARDAWLMELTSRPTVLA